MLTRIREKLEALGCTVWSLREDLVRGWEFYFIRHALDQNRVTEVRTVSVTLYRPLEGGLLGSASGEISPTASDAELEKALSDLYFQASLVKNPAYTLTDRPVVSPPPKEFDAAAIAEDFISAMGKVKETGTEDINSYEIFVKDVTRRFLNSGGVEYTVRYPCSMIEVVVNARREGHEIELYRNFTSGTCDAEKLRRDVEKALRFARDRLVTEPTPKLEDCDVILSTDDAVRVYEYFADRTTADMIYRKISDWEPGKPIAENVTGDRVTLRALSSLANSSADYPIDAEGAVIADRVLIRDGVPECVWGHRQFCQYMGVQDGALCPNLAADGGRKSEAELRSGDWLEVVEFSDFQVDPMGGDVAGEIRLGYLHRNGETRIVSGGSVSGRMSDVIPTMEFSSETEQYDTWVIPRVTKLKGLKSTGVASDGVRSQKTPPQADPAGASFFRGDQLAAETLESTCMPIPAVWAETSEARYSTALATSSGLA